MVAAMEIKNNCLYRHGPSFKSLPDLESRLNLTARAGLGFARPMPRLILMTDEKRLADPLPVVRALPPGSAVILRHYDDPYRADLAARLVKEARGQTWRKPGWLVTAAAHSPQALFRAWRSGADAALLSPVFPTTSHPKTRPMGIMRFASWCGASPLAVYALGGVTPANARRLKDCGAEGVAGIGGFIDKG
jgi:thiamine-phosphate pyrophosphorylase